MRPHAYEALLDEPSFSSRSLSGDMLDRLGRDIVGGRVAEGATLPREEELAATYRVSRTVVRDAVRMLAAKGLVETRTKRGTIVRQRATWHLFDDDVLRWLIAGGHGQVVQDLIELRQVIEPAAARLAAQRATAEDIERIRQACAQMAGNVAEKDGFLEADVAFHTAVLQASHNEGMAQLSQAIKVALLHAFDRSTKIRDATRMALPLHQAVYEAIRARNPMAAADAMAACVRQDDPTPRRGRARR
jgi:DNA-binding FadR family transcriptional regulator